MNLDGGYKKTKLSEFGDILRNIERIRATDESTASGWWMIYYKAHLLFEQGTPQRFVYNECISFRDRLFLDVGFVLVPDEAPDRQPSVALAVSMALTQYRWLSEQMRRRKQANN